MNTPNNYAPPKSEVGDVEIEKAPVDIEGLQVSASWKAKFRVISKAGGTKLPRFKELAFGERMKIGFNVLAFLFGPLYYLAKRMWRKAVVLFALCVAVIAVLQIALEFFGLGRFANALSYASGAVFAVRANIDYYKKMVLNDNGWW
ncbi:MAG: DUF2628 domain-containing protein [Rhizobiales bacterium]|nr:DUF2628 domain-containing protein [Rhizobacter sp.]